MAQFYFLKNNTFSQMFGCVIQTDNHTIVFDGGTVGDGAALADFLREKANAHVDTWFFTHPHHDHFGAFLDICRNAPDVQIDSICCHFPDTAQLCQYEGRAPWEIELWHYFDQLRDTRFADVCREAHVGDTFTFDDVTVRVLRVYNPAITANFINNSSCVYRIDTPRTKVLILGDLGEQGGDELLSLCDVAELRADYVQMAHHGQNGVNETFYRAIAPFACLWPTPDWLWRNDNGGGENSGPWRTLETRAWMEALGITRHIVSMNGTAQFEI